MLSEEEAQFWLHASEPSLAEAWDNAQDDEYAKILDKVKMTIVELDTQRITDWKTFHNVFQEVFGFPDFYGRNMDAWIDCMTSLDAPEAGMTSIPARRGDVVVLQLEHIDDFCRRCPEQYSALIECAAFVNWRRIEIGEPAVLALSFYKNA